MNLVLGSVTDLTKSHQGQKVLVGSHGGLAVGRHALRIGVSGLICHDAGLGCDEAGIACLAFLDAYKIPAAAVGHQTARIGDPQDMLSRGVITRVNEAARNSGTMPGISCRDAFARISNCSSNLLHEDAQLDQNPELIFERHEVKPVESTCTSTLPIVALDSASSIRSSDREAILATGSHGGLPGNATARAIKHKPRLVFFNDAGVGIDNAGISRLAPLDILGVPAVGVDCLSARIGDGRSTYETGIVSVVNERAKALSIAPGMAVKVAIETYSNRSKLGLHY